MGPNGVKLGRLDTILHTRGIQGLILLPAVGFPDLSELSWHRYTAVYADYFIDHPPLHCVCSDHYRSMVALLHDLGFKVTLWIMPFAEEASEAYKEGGPK